MNSTTFCEHRLEPIETGFLVRSYQSEFGRSELRAFHDWDEVTVFISNNPVVAEKNS